jgi:hypothetical protein
MKWVIDADYPQGHLVPLSDVELAQYQADQTAGLAAAQQQATYATNAAMISTAVMNRLAQIRTARTALANGQIFAALSANEKAVIDGLLVDDIYLGRIVLELFDGTT